MILFYHLPTWMADFHSKLVGQYTNPMDPTGFGVWPKCNFVGCHMNPGCIQLLSAGIKTLEYGIESVDYLYSPPL